MRTRTTRCCRRSRRPAPRWLAALAALGTAAAAWMRRVGPIGLPWQIIAIIARGRLLAPLRSD